MNRFSSFNDEELYMLKRQAIESSWNIVCEDRYSKEEVEVHSNLVNEIIDECRRRQV